MSQAKNRHTTNPSRRLVLAGFSVAVAPVAANSLPAAADSDDPIFALIGQHKAAMDAIEVQLTEKSNLEEELIALHHGSLGEYHDPRWIAAEQASQKACDEIDRMARALLDTRPTTAAGLATLVGYVHQYEADGFEWSDRVYNEYGDSFLSVLLRRNGPSVLAEVIVEPPRWRGRQ